MGDSEEPDPDDDLTPEYWAGLMRALEAAPVLEEPDFETELEPIL